MVDLNLHEIFKTGLFLVMIAAGTTAIAKKMKQPYPIALVIVGAIIGLLNVSMLEPLKLFITEGEIFNFVIVTLFLPALLGEAALKLPFSHLKDNKEPILALAFAGTLLSFLIIGFSAYYLLGLSLSAAFVFGALMSATDPVSVLSIFKSVGVKKRLEVVIEGESLFNDGLAVVLFKISAFSLITYLDAGWSGLGLGVWDFIRVISLGLIIGGAMGYGFSVLTKYYDDYPLEIIFSIILFYGSFLIAESVHASGVIAVVVGALIFGNFGARIGMSPTTKLNINNFWEVTALLANSIVFLMIGLEITRIDINDKWGMIIGAIIVVLISRSAAVYLSMISVKNFSNNWKHILNWGGLKGSLSIALVLSLPRDFQGRENLLILAFSVVLFSLLVQGLSIKPLISYLGVNMKDENHSEYEKILAKLYRYEKAMDEIKKAKGKYYLTKTMTDEFLANYQLKMEIAFGELEELFKKNPKLKEKQMEILMKFAYYAEHEAIDKLSKEEIISSVIADSERKEITEALVRLTHKQKG